MVGQTLTIDRQLGARIRSARVECNLSQAALGALLGVSSEQVTRFENGDAHISSEQLTDIAAVLGQSVSFFFHDWVARSVSANVVSKAPKQELSTVASLATWRSDVKRTMPSGGSFRHSHSLECDHDWDLADQEVGYLQ